MRYSRRTTTICSRYSWWTATHPSNQDVSSNSRTTGSPAPQSPTVAKSQEDTHGAHLLMEPIKESAHLQDLVEAIEFGNHKSAIKEACPKLMAMLEKECGKGWQLTVLPIFCLPRIPGVVVGPLGLVDQETLNKFGHRIPKNRLTHDQSYGFSSKQSLNKRVIEDYVTLCQYGFALQRFIHMIVALRERYPQARILLSKFDFKLAYQRVYFRAESAFQSCITAKGIAGPELALISLRATFGGSP